ncbi:CHAT domain-containing protein [Herpetosiphon giganteus]|uniref:CHAT domain-containing protein n=1 Tax=Herpetosiphon giganteus TaxID=2029754 RepID=UPI0019577479|nr:CHAT domain-containing protein [Herpetosiphon giganteus]MBM7845944.1 hypothetical protein [Herpetosiphon giganteus]
MSNLKASDSFGPRKDPTRDRMRIGMTIEPGASHGRINGQRFSLGFAAGDILNLNNEIINVLDKLRKDVQRKGVDLTGQSNYLTELRKIGLAAYNTILSDEITQTHFLNEDHKNPNLPPRLTLEIPMELNLIWEVLYSGDPSGKVDPECFWGFRYPLGRYFWDTVMIQLINLREGILAGIHSELIASSKEVEHLRTNLTALDIALKMTLLDQALSADTLTSDTLMELFIDQNFPYGIIHFACHCNNPAYAGATKASLNLTVHNKDLEISILDLLNYKKKGFRHNPFIFVNACETQNLGHLLQTISLPSAFLNFRAGSVIATACTMPDVFASEFARVFYQLLLAGPNPSREVHAILDAAELNVEIYRLEYLAEVLLATRLYFLKHYNNPLGLAYGLYAVSDQKIQLW